MKLKAWHWLAALIFSVSTHLFAASFMQATPEDVLIEGGGAGSVVLLGDATADALAAGDPDGVVDPSETDDSVAAEEIAAVDVAKVEESAVVQPEMRESVTSEAEIPPEAEVAPTVEQPVQETVAALPAETEPVEEIEPLPDPPVPAPRPEVAENPVKKQAEVADNPKPETRKQARPAKKPARGNGGASNANAQQASSAEDRGSAGSGAGNAAVSNYPGKVASRLRRALRYPKSALGGSRSGQAQVAFTVTANGQAVSIRIVGSSGSPALDQAAVDAVKRASPFPPIPAEAGRAQWPFAVPVLFKR